VSDKKSFSERATRFIPVDMRDRVKAVFNRTAGKTAMPAAPHRDDDIPDYSVIFNTNRAPGQKKVRFNGPLEPPQLSQSAANHKRLAGSDDIEEAEIVRDEAPAIHANGHNTGFEARSEDHHAHTDGAQDREPIASLKPSRPRAEQPAEGFETRQSESPFASSEKMDAMNHIEQNASNDSAPATQPESTERHHDESAPARYGFDSMPGPEAVRLKKSEPRYSDEPMEEEPAKPEQRRAEETIEPVMASAPFARAASSRAEEEQAPPPMPEAEEKKTQAFVAPAAAQAEQAKPTFRAHDEPAPTPASSERSSYDQNKETSMAGKPQEATDNGVQVRPDGTSGLASIAIERNSKFSGQLKFSGAIAIDGQVEGELVAERVVVHEGGVVNATIEGNSVVIAGTVKGDVYARGDLEILPSGVVHGSVTTPAISVRRGGRVEGRCVIGAPRQ
jgi:cytoskeletal protein CcmA (bactofilin family)